MAKTNSQRHISQSAISLGNEREVLDLIADSVMGVVWDVVNVSDNAARVGVRIRSLLTSQRQIHRLANPLRFISSTTATGRLRLGMKIAATRDGPIASFGRMGYLRISFIPVLINTN